MQAATQALALEGSVRGAGLLLFGPPLPGTPLVQEGQGRDKGQKLQKAASLGAQLAEALDITTTPTKTPWLPFRHAATGIAAPRQSPCDWSLPLRTLRTSGGTAWVAGPNRWVLQGGKVP